MILADKIINLRKKSGFSQEELAGKIGVSRQAISKWESAQSIPDLDKILLMSDLFGVSTDFLLKDEIEMEEPSTSVNDGDLNKKKVTMQMANEFINLKYSTAKQIAFGVLLCILSPIVLITMGAISEIYGLNENLYCGIGLVVLLLLVAIAVLLFVNAGFKTHDYEFLQTELFETEYGVTGMVKEKKKSIQETYFKANTVGITLCVLGVIPMLIGFLSENELYGVIGLTCMFVIVALGVYLMVFVGCKMGALQRLLQEGEYAKEKKENNKVVSAVGGIYWTIVTAIYLLWSFLTDSWHISWIVWVIAGVLFGGITILIDALSKKNTK